MAGAALVMVTGLTIDDAHGARSDPGFTIVRPEPAREIPRPAPIPREIHSAEVYEVAEHDDATPEVCNPEGSTPPGS